MDKYRLYVDESGTSSYKEIEGNKKYLMLSGIIIRSSEINTINYNMNLLKEQNFDYDIELKNIILHDEDIFNKKKGFENLTESNKARIFERDLFNFLSTMEYTIIAVLFDKEARQNRYTTPKDSYSSALEALIKRYVMFLEEKNACGDIMLEERNKNDNNELQLIYKEIYENGTKKSPMEIDIKADRFQSRLISSKLYFKQKKDNISGLQIADLLARPLKFKMILEKEKKDYFSDYSFALYKQVEHKIRRSKNGNSFGFGLVYF